MIVWLGDSTLRMCTRAATFDITAARLPIFLKGIGTTLSLLPPFKSHPLLGLGMRSQVAQALSKFFQNGIFSPGKLLQ